MIKSPSRVGYPVVLPVGTLGQSMTKSPGSASSLDVGLPAEAPASVDVAHPLQRISRVEQSDGQLAVAIEPAALCRIFGVTDPSVATRLLSQLIGVIQPDPRKPVDAASVDQVLSLIEDIKPTDALEAMTAAMLVGAQHAALDSMRRASHPEQTPAGRQSYTALSLKAMRTFAQLLDSLNHGRGKGVTQQIIVKRVSVEPGAQAVVGSVNVDGRRGYEKSSRQSRGSLTGTTSEETLR